MALVTHQMQQGSCATFPMRPLSWSKGFKVKQHVSTHHMFGRIDRRFSIKRNIRLNVGACANGLKLKFLKIAAFKGSLQKDEYGNRANGSGVPKNSVKVSYVPKETGETKMESPKVHSVPVSYTSEENEGIAGSPVIHKLFKKWLNMLSTHPPSQEADGILEGPPASEESQQRQIITQTKESSDIKNAIWSYFLGLDATIRIPLLIFIPMYLAVNVIYGADISKELTPLWIFGPLIIAFYIKMFRALWALYVFSFRRTVKLIKDLPTYHAVAYSYIAQGKLKEEVKDRVFQPVEDLKKLDYKELSRKKMKEFEEWFVDKYLDFVESIWPYYCRTIRFLKRANLI